MSKILQKQTSETLGQLQLKQDFTCPTVQKCQITEDKWAKLAYKAENECSGLVVVLVTSMHSISPYHT